MILENVTILIFRRKFEKFPGNILKISGMLSKVSRNARDDSVECSKKFQGMLNKIYGNAFTFKLSKATFYLK